MKNQHQVRLHSKQTLQVKWASFQTDSLRQQRSGIKFSHLILWNNLLTSRKEVIWFYIAKPDGQSPDRSSPRDTAGIRISKQLIPDSYFPQGAASGCGEAAEPSLQLPSIHPHCLPLSKRRSKMHCLPKHCSACSLWHRVPSPQGRERVSPCSYCHSHGIAQRQSQPAGMEPNPAALVIFLSGKTSLSGFTKDWDLKNEVHEIFTITAHDNEFSAYLYAIHTHI